MVNGGYLVGFRPSRRFDGTKPSRHALTDNHEISQGSNILASMKSFLSALLAIVADLETIVLAFQPPRVGK